MEFQKTLSSVSRNAEGPSVVAISNGRTAGACCVSAWRFCDIHSSFIGGVGIDSLDQRETKLRQFSHSEVIFLKNPERLMTHTDFHFHSKQPRVVHTPSDVQRALSAFGYSCLSAVPSC